MIGIRLEGGLGNQLFQYAAGRSLALRHKTDLVLDESILQRRMKGVTTRRFELSNFKLCDRVIRSEKLDCPSWVYHTPLLSRFFSPWHIYVEKHLGFNYQFDSLPDDTLLIGYWQSFRYLSNVIDSLIDELTPIAPLSSSSICISQQIDSSLSVALHVRRGDYVSLASAANFHGALSSDYYIKAIQEVSQAVQGARYFVFSDDPDWCRSNLFLDENAVFVTHNVGADSWQDLMLMSRCKHHIIANSSFSWWGALLADKLCHENVNRIVIAPARWFAGKPDLNLSDRFPPHWLVR